MRAQAQGPTWPECQEAGAQDPHRTSKPRHVVPAASLFLQQQIALSPRLEAPCNRSCVMCSSPRRIQQDEEILIFLLLLIFNAIARADIWHELAPGV